MLNTLHVFKEALYEINSLVLLSKDPQIALKLAKTDQESLRPLSQEWF